MIILVLCTGNSARSILGEALFARLGEGMVHAFSAGSKPVGAVNPAALTLLAAKGYDTSDFRSKSWDEFSGDGAPAIDAVVTVCANAAGETCPVWPGAPVTVHWGFPDPAHIEDEAEKAAAFEAVYAGLEGLVAGLIAQKPTEMAPEQLREAMQALYQESGIEA